MHPPDAKNLISKIKVHQIIPVRCEVTLKDTVEVPS